MYRAHWQVTGPNAVIQFPWQDPIAAKILQQRGMCFAVSRLSQGRPATQRTSAPQRAAGLYKAIRGGLVRASSCVKCLCAFSIGSWTTLLTPGQRQPRRCRAVKTREHEEAGLDTAVGRLQGPRPSQSSAEPSSTAGDLAGPAQPQRRVQDTDAISCVSALAIARIEARRLLEERLTVG